MNILIVAHPDDEVLWFDPSEFDRIVIVFGPRDDKPGFEKRRLAALAAHPLAQKITFLNMPEPGKDSGDSAAKVREEIAKRATDADVVTTHNAQGEYGHPHHVLVHNICMEVLNCRVNGKDPAQFRAIKKAYVDQGCWTWH